MIAFRAKRSEWSGIADRVAGLPSVADLRAPAMKMQCRHRPLNVLAAAGPPSTPCADISTATRIRPACAGHDVYQSARESAFS
jgi:hypothetical protein